VITDAAYTSVGGALSMGDFGTVMREIFEPQSNTHFDWERWTTLRKRPTHVFTYRVPLETSKYSIHYSEDEKDEGSTVIVGYHGSIFVDNELAHPVVRIVVEAENIPPSFPVQQVKSTLDYDFTKIGDREFLLPLVNDVRMHSARLWTKNVKEFRLYRKFSADAVIKFDGELNPLPDDKTKEQTPQPAAAAVSRSRRSNYSMGLRPHYRYLFVICLGAWAQAGYTTVEQIKSFIRSAIQLKNPDKEVALTLRKMKMSERLDLDTVEALQGEGAGPRTVAALKELATESASLSQAKPPAPKPVYVPPPPPSSEAQAKLLAEVKEYGNQLFDHAPGFHLPGADAPLCRHHRQGFVEPPMSSPRGLVITTKRRITNWSR
jgi:hypothetical protein